MTRAQQLVLGYVRELFEREGRTPTLDEIGQHFGYSTVAAWKHVTALIAAGHLKRSKRGSLVIPGAVNLTAASTEALRSELARREAKACQDLAA